MNALSDNDLIKYLSFFLFLMMLNGCAGAISQHDLSTCVKRGGKIEYRCTVMSRDSMGRNTGCQMHQNICIGGMTHAKYEKQQKLKKEREQLSKELKSKPRPVRSLSPEEKLEAWKSRMKVVTNKSLAENSHKYPKLTWLSSKWCLKGSNSKIPANFYNVVHSSFNKRLHIHYIGSDTYSGYTHVEISGNYFDLWDFDISGSRPGNERGRRLKKISDKEHALIYIFEGRQLPGSWSKEKMKKFMVSEGSKIGPADYIKNPKVFVKCK